MKFVGEDKYDDLPVDPQDYQAQREIQNQIIEFVVHLRGQNLSYSNTSSHIIFGSFSSHLRMDGLE